MKEQKNRNERKLHEKEMKICSIQATLTLDVCRDGSTTNPFSMIWLESWFLNYILQTLSLSPLSLYIYVCVCVCNVMWCVCMCIDIEWNTHTLVSEDIIYIYILQKEGVNRIGREAMYHPTTMQKHVIHLWPDKNWMELKKKNFWFQGFPPFPFPSSAPPMPTIFAVAAPPTGLGPPHTHDIYISMK